MDSSGAEREREAIRRWLPIYRKSDPVLQAKAALMLARANVNTDLLLELMTNPDSRVRANVVEGHQPKAPDYEILQRAIEDSHHRVVCNALVIMADIRPQVAARILRKLTASPDRKFRAGAAWAIGQCAHLQLTSELNLLRTDPHPNVRFNALRSLVKLSAAGSTTD
jgi:HEAT repeat protein